jgi:O-succinylbenzoate synthase
MECIEVYRVGMPLVSPFRTAYGSADVVESVLVRMSGGGLHGWGEATPWGSPMYSSEWAAGVYQLVRDWFAPCLVGQCITSAEQLQDLLAPFKGNPFAKASLDLAWWDLDARRSRRPLWMAVGGVSETVDVGADFGVMDRLDDLLQCVGRAVDDGFPRIKLKIRPGWDLAIVRGVRNAFPDAVLHVDCNAAYTLRDVDLFQALDELDLAMIEQPLHHDDLLDHATLQRSIRVPICLDESITSVARARQAIDIGSCRWINVKPGRMGGLTPAREVLAVAERAAVPCWIGGMLESGIGAAHCLALATCPNVKYPSDIFPAGRFYAADLASPRIRFTDGPRVAAFAGAGIGCEPDPGRLRSVTLEHCRLSAASVAREVVS